MVLAFLIHPLAWVVLVLSPRLEVVIKQLVRKKIVIITFLLVKPRRNQRWISVHLHVAMHLNILKVDVSSLIPLPLISFMSPLGRKFRLTLLLRIIRRKKMDLLLRNMGRKIALRNTCIPRREGHMGVRIL